MGIGAGRVDARVKGSRPRAYVVSLVLPTLGDEVWDRVAEALASQARYAALLLAGEMPPDIEQVFRSVAAHLFPRPGERLKTSCSCPDWADPCKHVAAVHYVLGDEFDRDPFLLFRLRGRTKEAFIAALRARRSAPGVSTTEASVGVPDQAGEVPLEQMLDRYWDLGEGFDELQFKVEAPPVAEAVLKRLGNPAPEEGDFASAELARLYRAISQRAIRAAYDES